MTETYNVVIGPEFTKDSPRPLLQVAVGVLSGEPVVSVGSLFWFFKDSAAWNAIAGDPEKEAGLLAAADVMDDLFSKIRLERIPEGSKNA